MERPYPGSRATSKAEPQKLIRAENLTQLQMASRGGRSELLLPDACWHCVCIVNVVCVVVITVCVGDRKAG